MAAAIAMSSRQSSSLCSYENPAGTYSFRCWSEGDVLFAEVEGVETLEDGERVVELLQAQRQERGRPVLMCDDITALVESKPKARQYIKKMVLEADSPIGRLGIIGGGSPIRTMFDLYGRVSNVPIRLFSSRDEAVGWLTS